LGAPTAAEIAPPPPSSTEPPPPFSIMRLHHRAMVCIIMASALAHLRLHHLQPRRHLVSMSPAGRRRSLRIAPLPANL